MIVFLIIDEYKKSVSLGELVSSTHIMRAYFFSIGMFSLLYFRIYQICPECFKYSNKSNYSSDGMEQLVVYIDFIMFST